MDTSLMTEQSMFQQLSLFVCPSAGWWCHGLHVGWFCCLPTWWWRWCLWLEPLINICQTGADVIESTMDTLCTARILYHEWHLQGLVTNIQPPCHSLHLPVILHWVHIILVECENVVSRFLFFSLRILPTSSYNKWGLGIFWGREVRLFNTSQLVIGKN